MKSDTDIKRDVEAELRWDPDIDATDIAVAVKGGVVALIGFVRSYTHKWQAEDDVKRVAGVIGIANDLEVRLPAVSERPDPDIARDAVAALKNELPYSSENMKVIVKDGWTTLKGSAEWNYQRTRAEEAVRRVRGIKGVINLITLKPRVAPSEIKSQAGASARIENYLGFPTGISGQELAARAYVQAQKFGAGFAIPEEIVNLACDERPLALGLGDGGRVQAKAVVVAAGARYRRLDIANFNEFEGRGIWYWASPIEARMCRSDEAVVVGGGNSAGQAAVFLSGFAKTIWMLVRGPSLAESMSRYLIERIAATDNIKLLFNTEVTALGGSPNGCLEQVRWKNRTTGEESERRIRNLFLFIGADPATDWLRDRGVTLDAKGFVQTGADVAPGKSRANDRPEARLPLESSVRGVFAVGDVRLGSVKRVGAAIGEGAAVVSELHSFLAQFSGEATPPKAMSTV